MMIVNSLGKLHIIGLASQKEDYQRIYELAPGGVFKFAHPMQFETVYERVVITHKPDSIESINIVLAVPGHQAFTLYGQNTAIIQSIVRVQSETEEE